MLTVVADLILFSLMFILAADFVYLCMAAARSVLQRLISALAIHIPEALRPLFDPSLPEARAPLERSFWDYVAPIVVACVTGAVAIYLCIVVVELWNLFRMT